MSFLHSYFDFNFLKSSSTQNLNHGDVLASLFDSLFCFALLDSFSEAVGLQLA